MKVAVKNEKVRTIIPRRRRDFAEDKDAESVTEDVVSTSYDVPTSSVAKISALLGDSHRCANAGFANNQLGG